MKKLWVGVVLLMLILPSGLRAAIFEDKKDSQGVSPEADLEAFKVQLAQNKNLTDGQRDAMLSERMKHTKTGMARSSKDLELSKKQASMPPQAQKPATGAKTAPSRAILQSVRPPSKAENKQVKEKTNTAEKIAERNVLVH